MSQAKLEKPKQKIKKYYDYNKCRNYLEKKYNYDERDYAGKYKNRYHEDKPYLDFWHWVCDNFDIHNGCMINFLLKILSQK